jgi:hypothetical protein
VTARGNPWSQKLRGGMTRVGRPYLLGRSREELQVRRYMRFHRMRYPREMGESGINAFPSHLATEKKVSASTGNQDQTALLFLYRTVLGHSAPPPKTY